MEFELTMMFEPSVFEQLRFHYSLSSFDVIVSL